MTTRLAEAFRKAEQLPDALQEQLASQLLEDLAGEAVWDCTLQEPRSQRLLDTMAQQALKASRTGQTQKKGFGEL